jgi:hypothetical protein
VSETITVPAALARCAREGLHSEIGTAAEQVASITQLPGERPMYVYREPLKRQLEAQLLLEEIGGETPDPPVPFEADIAHHLILIRALEGQQRSYIERSDEMEDDERRLAGERVRELDALVGTVKASKPEGPGPG